MEDGIQAASVSSCISTNELSNISIPNEREFTKDTECTQMFSINSDDKTSGSREDKNELFNILNHYEPTLFYIQKIKNKCSSTETKDVFIKSEVIKLPTSKPHTEKFIQACFVAFLARVNCDANVHVGILTEKENNCPQKAEALQSFREVTPCIFEIDHNLTANEVFDVCIREIEKSEEARTSWRSMLDKYPELRNQYSSRRHNLVIGCQNLYSDQITKQVLKVCNALISFQCKDTILMEISYSSKEADVFSRVIGVLRHFSNFLSTVDCTGITRQLKTIPLVSDIEMSLLYDPNVPEKYSQYQQEDIFDLFENQCILTPLSIAVKTSSNILTYRSLLYAVKHFCSLLNEVLPYSKRHFRDIVAVHLPNAVSYITAILALAKCKVAFLPLPIDQPTARMIFTLKDSQVRSMITSREALNKMNELRHKISISAEHEIEDEHMLLITFDDDFLDEKRMEPKLDEKDSDVLYVMYTSGSTGRPKGVKVNQVGVINMARALIDCWGIVQEDVIAQFASVGFDASILEIFTALLSGASLAILHKSERHGRCFIYAMNQMKVTVIILPPSALSIYSPIDLPALRIVVAGGEVCTSNIAMKWTVSEEVCFFNAYGPTECTVCTTVYKFCRGALKEDFNIDLPIGKTIDGVKVFLFDTFMNPVPPGVVGEIFIGGKGISNGYIGHASHFTQERFVQNPLTNAEFTLYKSGDLGFQDLNGEVTFIGRIDSQVKIRGHRIDLSEIEQVLLRFPNVESVVVVAHKCSMACGFSVAAFVSPKCLCVSKLREYANKVLPGYMMPAFFKQIDIKGLPQTINGKIDRKRLEYDESIHEEITESSVNYLDETQKMIAKYWCDIFHCDDTFLTKVQRSTSFSQLGGNSLQLVLLLRKIEEDHNVTLPIAAFAPLDTIKEFADAFQKYRFENAKCLPSSAKSESELRETIFHDSDLKRYFQSHHIKKASVPHEHSSSLSTRSDDVKHYRKLLISGVTGFLGAFLLFEILEQSDFLVFCMVRGATETKCIDRLVTNMKLYGLWKSDYLSRIRVVLSENSKKNLGIIEETYEFLCREIDVIFINAAQMNFNRSYEHHRAVNVSSTKEFIKLATQGRQKYLFFTSSISVFLFPSKKETQINSGTRKHILESDQLDDPVLLQTGYGQSKWACERLVFQALKNLLGGAIFRPGNISGRSTDGIGPKDDLFARTVYGIKKLGAYPCIDYPFDFIPVDFCAKSMIEIAIQRSRKDGDTKNSVYHLYNKDTIPFQNLFDGLGLKCLSLDEWRTELKHADADNDLVPLTPFFMSKFWEMTPNWPVFDTTHLDNEVSNNAKELLKPANQLWQIYKLYFGI